MKKKKYEPPLVYDLTHTVNEAHALDCLSGTAAGGGTDECGTGFAAGQRCTTGNTPAASCGDGNSPGGADDCLTGSLATKKCRSGGAATVTCKTGSLK